MEKQDGDLKLLVLNFGLACTAGSQIAETKTALFDYVATLQHQIAEYKSEWEFACERERSMRERELQLQKDVSNLQKLLEERSTKALVVSVDEGALYSLQSENERLRKALEFYASEDSYTKVDVWNTPIMIDAGEIARTAIRKISATQEAETAQ